MPHDPTAENAPCRCGQPDRPRWRHGLDVCLSEDVDRVLDEALGPAHNAPFPQPKARSRRCPL